MSFKSAVVVLFTLSLGSAALAESQPAPTQAASDGKQTVIICKTMHVLGSRIARKKQCATKKQWEDRAYRDRQMLEKIQNQVVSKE